MLDVLMPKMGISVSEGTILEWRKQPGDWVEADETLADVTTDKVDVEIPSPATGRLARIVAEAGDTVDGRRADRRDRRRRARRRGPSAGGLTTSPLRARRRRSRARPTAPGSSPRSCGESPTSTVSTSSRSRAPASAAACARRTCSPTSRRGGNGKQKRPRCSTPSRPYRPEPPVETAAEAPIADGDRREPMSTMRKAIARHMVDSRQHRRALHDDRRGRHVSGRRPAGTAQAE